MQQSSPRTALRRPLRTIAVGLGSAALALGLTGCLDSAESARERAAQATATASEGGLPSPSPTQDSERRQDIAFASAMVKNLRQSVEYSEMLLDKGEGVDEEARRVAAAITDRRPDLIDRLTGMLNEWGVATEEEAAEVAEANPTPTSSGFATGPTEEELEEMNRQAAEARRAGLLTSEEKRALEAASVEDAGRVYLLQMHRLHFGSVMIADTEVEDGKDDAAKDLAGDIADDHRRVIDDLQNLLGEGEMGAIIGGSRDHEPNPKSAPESINNDDGPVTFKPDPVEPSPSEDEEDRDGRDGDDPSPSPSPADTNAPRDGNGDDNNSDRNGGDDEGDRSDDGNNSGAGDNGDNGDDGGEADPSDD